jgi:hypothetical protein
MAARTQLLHHDLNDGVVRESLEGKTGYNRRGHRIQLSIQPLTGASYGRNINIHRWTHISTFSKSTNSGSK